MASAVANNTRDVNFNVCESNLHEMEQVVIVFLYFDLMCFIVEKPSHIDMCFQTCLQWKSLRPGNRVAGYQLPERNCWMRIAQSASREAVDLALQRGGR